VDADPESALRAIPLFAGLDAAAMADLAGYMTSFEAPAGQVLVEIGQPGSGLFVIGGALRAGADARTGGLLR